MVRDFASTWALPSSTRITATGGYMDDGKIVVWSVKPPAADAESRWKNAADDVSGANGIDAQLRALHDGATTHGVPYAVWSVGHEPHDDTSYGTATEYRSIYDVAMARKQLACGTAPNYGQPCSKVLIAYIAVPSNMTTGSPVGSTDSYRPDGADFDIFGADPYNWGCWRKQHDPQGSEENPRDLTDNVSDCKDGSGQTEVSEWRSFEKAVDDASSSSSLLDLAALHDKKVILAEVGSHPGCDGTEANYQNFCNGSLTNETSWNRNIWFTDMSTYLLNDDEAQRYIVGFTYYHVNNLDETSGYGWNFDDYNDNGTSSPDVIIQAQDDRGRQGWLDGFVNNSRFTATAWAFSLYPTP